MQVGDPESDGIIVAGVDVNVDVYDHDRHPRVATLLWTCDALYSMSRSPGAR